ncbi:MAG: phage portal protein [Lachnospiraceae bacterium]|nr:phage portal protein [Lachnospiraceae bacterium]
MADNVIHAMLDKRVLRVPAGAEMTERLLSGLIAKHKELVERTYKPLGDAYEGNYQILRLPKKPAWKPDARIACNFAKYISDTFNGFFIGIPIKLSVDAKDDREDKDGKVKGYVEFLDSYNSQDDNNAELSKLSSNFGTAYEMYYTDEDGESGITYLSPMEAFMVYDDSILSRPMFFVRYAKGADGVERGSYSDGTYVRHFEMRGGVHFTDEPYEHHFCDVPATEFVHNRERMSIYEDALYAINAFNKALSEKANDVDYFADAYMKIKGVEVGDNDAAHIRTTRIINLFERPEERDAGAGSIDMDAEFMAKPDSDSTQEHLLDRLYKMIFQLSMVVDLSDESFGSASGIALKYKLTAMYNLFRTKERKFSAALNRRYKILFSSPTALTHGVKPDDWLLVKSAFTPNFPANTTEEVENAAKLEGVVSKETQLGLLSCIDDVAAELERMEGEQEALLEQARSYGKDLPEKGKEVGEKDKGNPEG